MPSGMCIRHGCEPLLVSRLSRSFASDILAVEIKRFIKDLRRIKPPCTRQSLLIIHLFFALQESQLNAEC